MDIIVTEFHQCWPLGPFYLFLTSFILEYTVEEMNSFAQDYLGGGEYRY